jgi:DNA-directed RNA polymerase specialized sigma24 family protein
MAMRPSEPCSEGPSILEHISTHWHCVGDPLQFVMRYAPAIRRYVGALIRNPHDCEDVVQDFLMRAVCRPFTPEQIQRGRFRDYLKAALRNAAVTHFRRGAQLPSSATDIDNFAADIDDTADRAWLDEWRDCLMRRAWQALELHEQAAPEGIAYTALRLAADFRDESSAALAARASALTGRAVGVAAFRKQLSRARRHFAQMIVDEIRQTLEDSSADDVVEELRDLGLMEFVRDFLPEPFRSLAMQGPA